MRMDKFLKNSRIIKRRTVAKEACLGERVLLNDKIAKPGDEGSTGDKVEICFESGSMKVQVKELLENPRKADHEKMYEVME